MKRFFDVFLLFLAALPVFCIGSVLFFCVRHRLGSPVFFRQSRPGKGGEVFELIKFRTMTDSRGADGLLLPDEERMTKFGSWLRATSMDELPEIWNVLRGEMSFVGPRPLLTEYLSLYDQRQNRRHEVLPGITGWAQVNGRNLTSWEERLEMDVWYVDHHDFSLDIKILVKTVITVLKRDGVSAEDHVTMPRFEGSDKVER